MRDVQAVLRHLTAGAVVVFAPTIEAVYHWLGLPERAKVLAEPGLDCPGDLLIDRSAHRTYCNDRRLPLTERELQILVALAEEPGRAWAFRDLFELVWDAPYGGDRATVRAAVDRLRRKLSQAGSTVSVDAVRGVGFRLGVPEV